MRSETLNALLSIKSPPITKKLKSNSLILETNFFRDNGSFEPMWTSLIKINFILLLIYFDSIDSF